MIFECLAVAMRLQGARDCFTKSSGKTNDQDINFLAKRAQNAGVADMEMLCNNVRIGSVQGCSTIASQI